MIALNSALAEQLVEFKKDVDELIEKGEPKISAILEVIRRYIKICKPIHFDGNGYSDEWKAEAARRGLDLSLIHISKLTDVIDNGAPLDRSIADEVAAGMKKWAVEMGATHYLSLIHISYWHKKQG